MRCSKNIISNITFKCVYHIVASDESWINAYEPENKEQSTIWVFQVEPNPINVAIIL